MLYIIILAKYTKENSFCKFTFICYGEICMHFWNEHIIEMTMK